MKSAGFIRKIKGKFSIKLFIVFSLFIILISSSFTALFINYQSKAIKDTLVSRGDLLIQLLAYNSRLGVYSENIELLQDAVNGILRQKGVLEVSVFNSEGRLLKKQQNERTNSQKAWTEEKDNLDAIFHDLRESGYTIYFDKSISIGIWSSVTTDSGYFTQEALFFDEPAANKTESVIGFVSIIIDKRALNEEIKGLLLRSMLIFILFFLMGLTVSYIVAGKITGPLKRLANAIRSFGEGKSLKKLSIETSDEIGKLAVAFNNMSESLKRREAEKENLAEQLRQAHKMEAIGTLAGGIAHDFNNILAAICGNCELLYHKMNRKNPLRQYVEDALDSAKIASKLTKNLLLYSRKQPLCFMPMEINEHITGMKTFLKRVIGEDIEFNVELSGEDLFIMGDSGQIDQVLFNLAANARDAMPGGGILTITTESVRHDARYFADNNPQEKGKYVLITIKDTGIGMDQVTAQRIFEPFFTTKDLGKGTGLGLSTAYQIIKEHGGYIDLITEPNKGSIFKIYLPFLELEERDEKQNRLLISYTGSETVLIAEDNEKVRKLMKNTLEENGYEVIVAENGDDAIKIFLQYKKKINLLLFDVIMPGRNGKEAYEEIKKINSDIKVLFVSGYDDNILCKEKSPDEKINFIGKPISYLSLLKKVREVLDKL